jgi:hypothetical protein
MARTRERKRPDHDGLQQERRETEREREKRHTWD